jgi:membrane protein required for beta-lactamase induction
MEIATYTQGNLVGTVSMVFPHWSVQVIGFPLLCLTRRSCNSLARKQAANPEMMLKAATKIMILISIIGIHPLFRAWCLSG